MRICLSKGIANGVGVFICRDRKTSNAFSTVKQPYLSFGCLVSSSLKDDALEGAVGRCVLEEALAELYDDSVSSEPITDFCVCCLGNKLVSDLSNVE